MIRKTYLRTPAAQQKPDVPPPDRLRMLGEDKNEIDEMIEAHVRLGWVLIRRSYSMDDGHGAELVFAVRHRDIYGMA